MSRSRSTTAGLSLALLGLVASACHHTNVTAEGPLEAEDHDSEVPIAWFRFLYDAIQTEGLNALEASRLIGYAGVTAYETVVNRGIPTHNSLANQLNGLGTISNPVRGTHDWPTAVNSALATLFETLLANASPATLQALADLELQFETEFSATLKPEVFDRSVARGETVAGKIITWSNADEFTTWNDCVYTPPVGEGLWVPTPPDMLPAEEPCWGNLRPFLLLYGAECPGLAPPEYSTSTSSAFYTEAVEVRDTVNNLSADQLAIAQFWDDAAGMSGTPAGHWLNILTQVLEEEGEALDVAVEAYARIGIALADSYISSFEIKYYFNLIRPITYIQDPAGLDDGAWTTATGISTPAYPEYTAGHSVPAGAAAYVLTDLLGTVSFDDDTHAGVYPLRSFSSFDAAADEAGISRLYAGTNFRSGAERGIEQGRCVGRTIVENIAFSK